jgi:hypothetical protein
VRHRVVREEGGLVVLVLHHVGQARCMARKGGGHGGRVRKALGCRARGRVPA